MAAKQSRGVTGRNSRRDQSLFIALGEGKGERKILEGHMVLQGNRGDISRRQEIIRGDYRELSAN